MVITDKAKKLCAEILVEQGYANKYFNERFEGTTFINLHVELEGIMHSEVCGITSDTLEARRQADAVEDYLSINEKKFWSDSTLFAGGSIVDYDGNQTNYTSRQWRLDRIVWCLNKLAEDKE